MEKTMEGKSGKTAACRRVYEVAQDIYEDWTSVGKNGKRVSVSPCAKPYLDIMLGMDSIADSYGWDSGKEIVCRFLANASHYKGSRSRELKGELRSMAGLKP